MSGNKATVDAARERLCATAQRVLDHARDDVWGVEWDYDDEDWLRDTARAVERYRHWQATGEHDFTYLTPGLKPDVALADEMLIGLGHLLHSWNEYGADLDEDLQSEAEAAIAEYHRARKEAGGRGLL
jgi:hypothetical protein